MAAARLIWPPHPYRAGFCVTDDTDAATLENVRIVYEFLASIGLKTSKTVWVFAPDEPCGIPALPRSIQRGITLEDRDYLDFCHRLSAKGFEICLHGASAGNNRRERTAQALDFMERQFGLPGTYVCHAKNAENPYWHERVAPRGPAQWLLSLALASRYRCSGEDPKSPYFWGDLCVEKVRHIRLFRTRNVNTLAENPSMPYFDPEKPLVPAWFAATKRSFADCTSPEALEQLEREHGLCVLYQYMHRYADLGDGTVQRSLRAGAERLMGAGSIMVDNTSRIMDRLRLIQGVWFVRRGNELWLVNANDRDVVEIQLVVSAPASVSSPDQELVQSGETVRIPRLPANRVLALRADRALEPAGAHSILLDGQGHGSARFAFGSVFVNVAESPWRSPGGIDLGPRSCVAVFNHDAARLRPWSRASHTELYRLLLGQTAIVAREILFKGRPIDSKKFLGSEEIPLEDHANW
ncbi:MAG: hypothetical protein ACR2NO_03930 [Chloroflexota bacterium]